jgi:flagellar P-ring protein precursor FlgI
VGFLSSGGKVQREVPTSITSEHGFIYLDSKKGQGTFTNMIAVAETINRMYPGAAEVKTDGRTVKVAVPSDLPEGTHVAYLNSFLKQEIQSDNAPRVIVNERTGVIVIGGDVRLRPGAIAHGAIVVTVAESPQVSQPAPLSGGTTETAARTDISINEEAGALTAIPEAVTLQEVVDVLNVLGASPRDLISILAAMSDGGLLVADIKRL